MCYSFSSPSSVSQEITNITDDVFCILPRVEVTCKGLFLIQQHSKEQGQALVSDHSQHYLDFMYNFRMYNQRRI